MNAHRQHTDLRNLRINRRAEAALDYALLLGLGIMLAAAAASWWS